MLEIIIIWRLAVYIGRIAAQKGLKKRRYQVMAILLWICGELFGSLVGDLIFGGNGSFWYIYIPALIGALAGASIAFLIMKVLPHQHLDPDQAQSEWKREGSSLKNFGRSGWLPLLTSLLAISGLCVAFGGVLFFQMTESTRQINADNPMVGIKTDSNGYITQSVYQISPRANAIYFSFNLQTSLDADTLITFDWYIDGKIAYSFSRNLGPGHVVVALDREELGRTEFNKGSYEVKARIGDLLLTSATFEVK